MRVLNRYNHVINAVAGIVLSLLLLTLFFFDASFQSTANQMEYIQTQLERLASLEVSYIGSYITGIQAHSQESGMTPAGSEALNKEALESMLAQQEAALQGIYVFKLLDDGDVGDVGFTRSVSDTGEEQYIYSVPLPGSNWYVSISAPRSAFSHYTDDSQRVNLVFTLRVLVIFLILFLFIRYDLIQRQKELLAANEKLRVSDERFRIAVTHAADMVFEYDFNDRIIHILNENLQKNYVFVQKGVLESETWKKLIHPDDLSAVIALCKQITAGRREISLIIRARSLHSTQEYRWCRLSLTVIADKNRQPVQIVGTLADINEQQTETLTLRSKAERDSLTGLLNREECERQVERLLADSHGENTGAFLLMDMDDFKALNDSMGHVSGDAAQRMLANVLRKVFRESDITGRMGGDEFMVWLKDVSETEVVERKLAELKEALRVNVHRDYTLPDLPLSIGVVFAQRGDHFLDLYNMADIALYQAKREGRDLHMFYKREKSADLSELSSR